jgi:hypothetical protein
MSKKAAGELFPTDGPLAPDAMIGRDDDVDRLAGMLSGGVSAIVAGPRKTGKTSVCDAALEVVAADGCATARVDLFVCADAGDLAHRLTLAVLANRPALRRAVDTAARAGRDVLETLSTAVAFRARADLGDELELALDLRAARRRPGEALVAALELAQRLGERDDRRVVLFLDEFQDVTRGLFGDPDTVTRQMRAVLQRADRVTVLFAGSIAHLMRELFAPSQRAFSRFGSMVELSPIPRDNWREGLAARFADGGRPIAPSALERLLDLGEEHPRATMLLAQHAFLVAVETVARRVDDGVVVEGLGRALRGERGAHEQALAEIRSTGRLAQLLAERVADGEVLYRDLPADTAARTLRRLEDRGVVERTGRRGGWRFADPLLARYLRALA